MAKCPAHEDSSPSLSIATGRDGRVLLNCFGGCALADVLKALGLSMRDLFAGEPPTREQRASLAWQQQAQAEQRHRERQTRQQACERVCKLEEISNALAAKLAHSPEDAAEGGALTRLYHETLGSLREAEQALETRV